jgi:hypothetical protein
MYHNGTVIRKNKSFLCSSLCIIFNKKIPKIRKKSRKNHKNLEKSRKNHENHKKSQKISLITKSLENHRKSRKSQKNLENQKKSQVPAKKSQRVETPRLGLTSLKTDAHTQLLFSWIFGSWDLRPSLFTFFLFDWVAF